MMLLGNIISGAFDKQMNEFSLQQIKHFTTETIIHEQQLNNLYNYLKKHADDTDGHILTLYDQMPIRLSQEEIQLLLHDLEKVQSMYGE